MKTKPKLLICSLLCLSAALWTPPPAHAQTAAELRAIVNQYGSKDPSKLGSVSRGVMQTGGTIILDGKTGYLVNPNGTAVRFNDDVSAVAPLDGGNAGAVNSFIGVANIALIPFDAVLPDGSTLATLSLMDDSPTGEFAAVTEVSGAPVLTADTTYYKVGAASLKAAFPATAAAGDGFADTFSADDWEDEESIGFWIYSDATLTAGDLTVVLTESTGNLTYSIPAVVKNTWTWVEIDISALTGGTGNQVTAFNVKLSSAGATALGAFNVYLDGAWKWDASAEKALGVDLVDAPGAVRSFLTITRANTGTHGMTKLTEQTDYFVHTESGNDFLVFITDQSANSGIALVNHK